MNGPPVLALSGRSALSGFRIEKLLARLRTLDAAVSALSARFVHFAAIDRALTADERERLERLLTYGPRDVPSELGGQMLLVVPREGTISPWSSKATDIIRVCGLEAVQRVERGVEYRVKADRPLAPEALQRLAGVLLDRMTEMALLDTAQAARLFAHSPPRPARRVALAGGRAALDRINREMGLALSGEELDYLLTSFRQLGRDPTDAELMMFAQVNSEHCRHKIFNARWIIDGQERAQSLFAMIRHTHERHPHGVLSAYRDNAAVMEGSHGWRYFADPRTGAYVESAEMIDILMKVETHNHPTAISPFPGAATGAGGEIRDEGATGRGAKPKAGLTGFTVSNLRIPGYERPWERPFGQPERIASALTIMLEAPIGAASFNNEFGRPAICGYFRTFEQHVPGDPPHRARGYHKPIMIAGGLGNVRRAHVEKSTVPVGGRLIVLGGPALLIGLGGGAASSLGSGASHADLDFASVQRGNAEMQRRAQEVIDGCWALGAANPILLIHDVGAGGLSNAVPEAAAHSHRGARIDLRAIASAESGLSPLELWCNEAQERYVVVVAPDDLPVLGAIAARERCPLADIGALDATGRLTVHDPLLGDAPIDVPLDVLFGKPPRMTREVRSVPGAAAPWTAGALDVREALYRVLRLPAVADKTFLVTIGDRTVGGLVSRDPLVGPWQVPVSDVAVTLADHRGVRGEAMAMGERSPVALLAAPASGRLAVAEAITNILAADVATLAQIRLSANWMAACGEAGEDAALYETVRAVGLELCPALGIAIPVGKDSLSMRTRWSEGGVEKTVVAPVSLIVSAFAPIGDVRKTLTPVLQSGPETALWLIDLGRQRLGGSALAQVYGEIGTEPADLDDPHLLLGLAAALAELRRESLLLAYHDRSDGGLIVTVLEMAFAGHCGLEIDLPAGRGAPAAQLFAEEPGVVVQVAVRDEPRMQGILARCGLAAHAVRLGRPQQQLRVRITQGGAPLLDESWRDLRAAWSETSWQMRRLRDDPQCADEEYAAQLAADDPGLRVELGFDPQADVAAPYIARGVRPRIAVLREQGVNSHTETAASFDRAGFAPCDVHMTDLIAARHDLAEFAGLVACGGFSYGDVLGAGEGWAKSILFNPALREQFQAFFERPDTFALGICNGCQMFAALKSIIPGTAHWPRFVRNRSEQYESRLTLVEVLRSPSVLLAGMEGSILPIAVAHGEGRAEFEHDAALEACRSSGLIAFRYVDHHRRIATTYPDNPNGSPLGIAALTSADGRVTLTMPHPERSVRSVQNSWRPEGSGEFSGWMRLFRNARTFVG
ncbi:MAG: phosphoribosylformylglycinamidine synthase [Steroidobacteraceae bacterium]